MHLLPLPLGRLAEHADRRCLGTRFATNAVFLRLNADNTFEAVATDTKVLVRVTGPCVAARDVFPEVPEFTTRPGGGTSALVPADFWRRSFAFAKKLTTRSSVPALRGLAVRLHESETSFAATNGTSHWADSATNTTGRFPPYVDILASCTRTRSARERFAVDPHPFAELLRTAAEFCDEPAAPQVDVEPPGLNIPIVVRAAHRDGTQFFGLLMPLFEPATPVSAPASTPAPTPVGSGEQDSLAVLEQRCAELRAEKIALTRQYQELRKALIRAGSARP